MNLSTLKPPAGQTKLRKRVGRGMGSGHGKTSTRGSKGQRAGTGFGQKRGFEGGQMPLHRRLPKRGFTNIFRVEYAVLGLGDIAELKETELTLEKLIDRGLVKKRNGLVKVLANGELKTAVTVHAHKFSKAAQAAIEAAGGKAIVIGSEAPAA